MDKEDIYTVQELNNLIKTTINKSFNDKIQVKGEIFNYKKAHNNIFASLRDKTSTINVVSFSKIDYNLNNGLQVIANGRLDYYNKNGIINFIVNSFIIDSDELGDIYKVYEQTKIKYEKKGYYINKKHKPHKINNIGIVTSRSGAAIQDILYVLKNNNFIGNVYIKDCVVQGDTCHKSICSAISYFNSNKISDNINIDLLLITRGGGSFDDLMGFSHEDVLEEIHKSKYYTISAIGHEIDFMLSDYVADLRAPTPSIAAEIICEKQKKNKENIKLLEQFINLIKDNINNKIKLIKSKISNIEKGLIYINPINNIKMICNELTNKIKNNIKNKFNILYNKLSIMSNKLESKDITKQTNNGFCILFNNNNIIVRTKEDINNSDDNKYKLFIDGIYYDIIIYARRTRN
jgi:exodeoxyribonuclease VII large subunit